MKRDEIKENLMISIDNNINIFLKEQGVSATVEERLIFGDIIDQKEPEKIDIYIQLEPNLDDSSEKYKKFNCKDKYKYKDIINFEGEEILYEELIKYLEEKVLNETGFMINFHINNNYFEDIQELCNEKNIKLEDFISQNYKKRILLDKLNLSNSKDKNIMNSTEAKNKFIELADLQRGYPEIKMVETQKFIGGGHLCEQIEHIGDLTHRISQRTYINSEKIEHSLGDIKSKIENGIDKLSTNDVSLERFENRLESNFNHLLKHDLLENITSFKDFKDKSIAMLTEYSKLHSELPVYNIVQLNARDAAVNLGLFKFDAALSNLLKLDKIIKNEEFVKLASTYDPNYEKSILENKNKIGKNIRKNN
jgi:hypothetical protein